MEQAVEALGDADTVAGELEASRKECAQLQQEVIFFFYIDTSSTLFIHKSFFVVSLGFRPADAIFKSDHLH